jgi:pyrophosphate--fructose-6-phosphate 1-phosphotransferase
VLHTIGGRRHQHRRRRSRRLPGQNNYGSPSSVCPRPSTTTCIPIRQSLGAWTAAEQGARYFQNVVAEHNANPRMLIVHEVMGRNCGWLTAATAQEYRKLLDRENGCPGSGSTATGFDIHAVYVPEWKSTSPPKPSACTPSWTSRQRQHLRQRRRGRGEHRRRAAGQGPGSAARRLRPHQARRRQPRQMVRRAVRQDDRRRKDPVQKSGYFARAAAANATICA